MSVLIIIPTFLTVHWKCVLLLAVTSLSNRYNTVLVRTSQYLSYYDIATRYWGMFKCTGLDARLYKYILCFLIEGAGRSESLWWFHDVTKSYTFLLCFFCLKKVVPYLLMSTVERVIYRRNIWLSLLFFPPQNLVFTSTLLINTVYLALMFTTFTA